DRMRALLTISVSLFAASASGCVVGGHSCNAALYYPGVSVELDANLRDATYRVTALADGTKWSAEVRVQNGRGDAEVAGATPGDPHFSVSVVAGDPTIWVTGTPAGAPGPSHLEITLARDGATLAQLAYDPVYQAEELNGDGCGATLRAEYHQAIVVAP